jgi:hypothetical protein
VISRARGRARREEAYVFEIPDQVLTTRVSRFKQPSTVHAALWHTVMYGYHMDQNPEDGIYSLNFEAGHGTFVKQL